MLFNFFFPCFVFIYYYYYLNFPWMMRRYHFYILESLIQAVLFPFRLNEVYCKYNFFDYPKRKFIHFNIKMKKKNTENELTLNIFDGFKSTLFAIHKSQFSLALFIARSIRNLIWIAHTFFKSINFVNWMLALFRICSIFASIAFASSDTFSISFNLLMTFFSRNFNISPSDILTVTFVLHSNK